MAMFGRATRNDVLRSYTPTMAERIPIAVQGFLGRLGLNKYQARSFGQPIADVLGYSPVGAVAQSWDAGQSAARAPGMFGKAAGLGGGMALAALGAVPGGKALARKGEALAMDEASRMARSFGQPIADVLGYSPVGAVAQSWDAGQAAARAPGMFGKAAGLGGGMALAALGAVPGGKALRGAERIFYRGTNGSAERIAGGIGEGLLFASPQERIAKLYGDNIEKIAAKPEAKILRESSRDFARLIGRKTGGLYSAMRPGESVHSLSNDAIAKAREAGYDAVDFDKTTDVGTAIINEAAFIRNHGKPPLAMDEASRMARAAEQGFTVDAYHGTRAGDFEQFRPEFSDTARKTGTPHGAFVFSESPENATGYAGKMEGFYTRTADFSQGGSTIPTKLALGRNKKINAKGDNWDDIYRNDGQSYDINELAQQAKDKGYDSFTVKNVVDTNGYHHKPTTTHFIFNPANIRSKFAAFDPAKRGSANLLAGLGVGAMVAPSMFGNRGGER